MVDSTASNSEYSTPVSRIIHSKFFFNYQNEYNIREPTGQTNPRARLNRKNSKKFLNFFCPYAYIYILLRSPFRRIDTLKKSYTAAVVNVYTLMERRALPRNQRTVYRNPRSRVTIRATTSSWQVSPATRSRDGDEIDGQRRDCYR